MIFRRAALVAGVAVLATALAGCGAPATPTTSDGTKPLDIAVAFYPFQFVAERVAGDHAVVENLTAPGAEAHDVELTPRQLGDLASADLVVLQSGFQPAVDAALDQVDVARVVDAADVVDFIDAEGDDHDHEGEADDHDHGGLDPHTWLDPTNLAAVTEAVRDALVEIAPQYADDFNANADALLADLAQLDADYAAGLANCERRTFVTSHAAFGYLANRYNLEQVGIRGLEPEVEPTAARIAEVQQIARDQGITTIFFETLVSPVVAESIAGDLGLATAVLDPLEGLTDASPGGDYLEVMRANLAALEKANGCS